MHSLRWLAFGTATGTIVGIVLGKLVISVLVGAGIGLLLTFFAQDA